MTVILPEGKDLSKVRVAYLFHGLADNCTGWERYTSVERYARKYDAALVIPEVQRSFYADMKYGLDYFAFVSQELRETCTRFFGFSKLRENTYVMGLSMGGYAALKCAFTAPDLYEGCGAFSPITDLRQCSYEGKEREWKAIFGDQVPPKDDLFALLDKTPKTPPVYLACGNDDPRLFHSKLMEERLLNKGFKVRFEHWKGGHDWDFWDEASKRAFDFFFGGPKT